MHNKLGIIKTFPAQQPQSTSLGWKRLRFVHLWLRFSYTEAYVIFAGMTLKMKMWKSFNQNEFWPKLTATFTVQPQKSGIVQEFCCEDGKKKSLLSDLHELAHLQSWLLPISSISTRITCAVLEQFFQKSNDIFQSLSSYVMDCSGDVPEPHLLWDQVSCKLITGKVVGTGVAKLSTSKIN